MTTWTMDQVHAVRHMYAQGTVSKESVFVHGIEPFIALLAAELVEAIRVHAVEAHPNDMRVLEQMDLPATFQVSARVVWAPSTTTVELHGGPYDGQVVKGFDPWQPLLMPEPMESSPFEPEASAALLKALSRHIEYEIEGWHEQERRWAFGMRS